MRLLWKVNRTYAVQPGRGKKSVGRILLKKIRLEKLHEITAKDCIAEGINPPAGWNDGLALVMSKRPPNDLWNEIALRVMSNFVNLWDSIYSKTEFAFENNPDVWVLEFELTEKFQ